MTPPSSSSRDDAGFQSVAGRRARRAPSPTDLGDDAQWEEWRALTPPMPIDEGALDDLLSMPSVGTESTLEQCGGEVIVLGAGGTMGPTLARLVRRALDGLAASERDDDGDHADPPAAPSARRRVIAVSRFSSSAAESALRAAGVETIACDLTDRDAVARLPDAANVIFMAGQKFGTTSAPGETWMMNTVVPAFCADRYRGSRIVAFSTGNVYPLTPVTSGGSREGDAPSPVGEYASSCLGRERVFEHYATRHGTRVAVVRLNYAVDLRYGVLTDIALKVWSGEPVDVTMGYVNVIWQGDANRLAIDCLAHASTPPFVVNVTGSRVLSVRAVAERFGKLLGRVAIVTGAEAPDALLSDTTRMCDVLGEATSPVWWMMLRTADWIRGGGRLLGKPTKFERRDGQF
jgi:nucleoside-diphosphate-sugar epimerase